MAELSLHAKSWFLAGHFLRAKCHIDSLEYIVSNIRKVHFVGIDTIFRMHYDGFHIECVSVLENCAKVRDPRDVNAAKNILTEGLRSLQATA